MWCRWNSRYEGQQHMKRTIRPAALLVKEFADAAKYKAQAGKVKAQAEQDKAQAEQDKAQAGQSSQDNIEICEKKSWRRK